MAQSLHSSNYLLASLHPDKMAALLPHLKVLELPQETVLYERGDTIKVVYFPHHGVISLVVDLASGDMIEAAMVGRDSVAGGSSAFDDQISLNRAIVQVAGRASALDVEHFRAFAAQSEPFRANSRVTSSSSWRKPSNPRPATPPTRSRRACRAAATCWAAKISRSRRNFSGRCWGCVSIVAHILQQAGLIRYRRGHIRVLDLEVLRDARASAIRRLNRSLIGCSACRPKSDFIAKICLYVGNPADTCAVASRRPLSAFAS